MAIYSWNLDEFLHITDSELSTIGWPALTTGEDRYPKRCRKRKSPESVEKVKRLIYTISQESPAEIGFPQLLNLALCCLCRNYKGQRHDIATEFKNRLLPVEGIYICSRNAKNQLATLRTRLCHELAVEADEDPDEFILKEVVNMVGNLSAKQKKVEIMAAKLGGAGRTTEQAKLQLTEYKSIADSLAIRAHDLQRDLKTSEAHSQALEESLESSKETAKQLKTELEGLKSNIAEEERSKEDLKLSMAALEAQVGALKEAESLLQHRQDGLLHLLAETETREKRFKRATDTLREQLAGTDQKLSDQIQALVAHYEQNLTATKELTTADAELEQNQNQHSQAAAAMESLQLASTNLHGFIEQERARVDVQASRTSTRELLFLQLL